MADVKRAGETRGFCSINRYIQGPGELKRLPVYARTYGSPAVILMDPFFLDRKEALAEAFAKSGQHAEFITFAGECSDEEIARVRELAAGFGAGVVVGIGGGKTLDTIRAVSAELKVAEILCPTAASSDAPTSGLSVVYQSDHTCRSVVHPKHPEYVLVDTEIIVNAPVRMLSAGMGDALATYFEAVTTKAANNINNFGEGYSQTITGMALARLCFDTLMRDGRAAYDAGRKHIRTEAFENVVEANTLMSGLGTENTGCNISHGICSSLGTLPDTRGYLHGELVAFGVLCQLALENADPETFAQVYSFCRDVNLPLHLEDIGIREDAEKKVALAMQYGIEHKPVLRVTNYTVTFEKLYNAVMYVDSIGK